MYMFERKTCTGKPQYLRMRRLMVMALLTGAALICGCRSPRAEAERRIAERLPAMIGPADTYDVQVDGSLLALARGHAHAVHVRGANVRMTNGIVVDELRLDAAQADFDLQKSQIKKIGRIAFSARLTQPHLSDYLAKRPAAVDGLTVWLRPSEVEADVPVTAAGLKTTVVLYGTLAPKRPDAHAIDFVLSRAKIGKVPLPARLIDLAVQRVNPVVDLSSLKFPVALERTDVVRGDLILTGTTRLPEQQNLTE